ncbi:MAG: AAA family ATPase [Myxococcota bacterium]
MSLQSLPIGIHAFDDIIQGDFVYVDKTRYIHELVRPAKGMYFLARPRRFGKSLLISTLFHLFKGHRELFKGLWIEQETGWDWSCKRPVIHLDMLNIANGNPRELQQDLKERIATISEHYGVVFNPSSTLPACLNRLIEQLAQQDPPVVLIDEYDRPMVNHLGGKTDQQLAKNLQIAEDNRDVLRDFYGVLKGQSGKLRFLLVTGVSKFAHVSIFSSLSNLDDISLDEPYAALCGYTQQELEKNFPSHIDALASKENLDRAGVLDKVRNWYNGYQFAPGAQRVYNPFSTLLLLNKGVFRGYWFATGTPTFLTHLIKRNKDIQPKDLVNASVSDSAFNSYKLNELHECLLPLMVQTGYLTITGYDSSTRSYMVNYPNQEVREAFLESLMERYSHLSQGKAVTDLQQLTHALAQDDLEAFFASLRSILAGISYRLHIPLERYYQTVFYLIYQLLGYRIHTEVHTNVGRVDAVIDLDNHTYVFEFKLHPGKVIPSSKMQDQDALDDLTDPAAQQERAATLLQQHQELAQKALQQIKDRHYADKYLGKNKPVTLVGAVFTVNTMHGESVRQVTAWVKEETQ